jgi:hypothetical protein
MCNGSFMCMLRRWQRKSEKVRIGVPVRPSFNDCAAASVTLIRGNLSSPWSRKAETESISLYQPYNFVTSLTMDFGTKCSKSVTLEFGIDERSRIRVELMWLYSGFPSKNCVGIGNHKGPSSKGPHVLRICRARSSRPSFSQLRMPRKKISAPSLLACRHM